MAKEAKQEQLSGEDILSKIREEGERILANANKQAEKILAEAMEQAKNMTQNSQPQPQIIQLKEKGRREIPALDDFVKGQIKENEKRSHDMVEIRLFKDGKDYKDDLYVGINGKNFVIKRGVDVKVPRYVKEAIDNMQDQFVVANDMVNEASKGLKVLEEM